jgi:hypothetical protein
MHYDSDCQLDLVTKKNDFGRNINNVLFDKNEACLIATNGKAMAKIPCDVLGSDPEKALIPAGVVKELRIRNRSKGKSELVNTNGKLEYLTKNGIGLLEIDSESYPNWKRIVDDILESEKEDGFSLNPKLLLDLAKALGSDEAIRIIPHKGGKLQIIPHHSPEGKVGILMGIRDE